MVLEAMKMEHTLRAPMPGTVDRGRRDSRPAGRRRGVLVVVEAG